MVITTLMDLLKALDSAYPAVYVSEFRHVDKAGFENIFWKDSKCIGAVCESAGVTRYFAINQILDSPPIVFEVSKGDIAPVN